jgi:hypothetical protein
MVYGKVLENFNFISNGFEEYTQDFPSLREGLGS